MPQRRHRLTNSTVALALTAAALAVLAMLPNRRRKIRLAPRRLAASLAFTTLFFAGAAFTAGAGNEVAQFLEPGDQSAATTTDTTMTTTTEADAAAQDAAEAAWTAKPSASNELTSKAAKPVAAGNAYRQGAPAQPAQGQSAWRARETPSAGSAAQAVQQTLRPTVKPVWVKRAEARADAFNRA